MKKLSVLRDQANKCPFGLDITKDCKKAGDLVDLMDTTDVSKNKQLLLEKSPNTQCKYAGEIFDHQVNCLYNKVIETCKLPTLKPSDYYTNTMDNTGMNGLFTVPMDDQTSTYYHNLYYGFTQNADRMYKLQKRAEILNKILSKKL